MEAQGPTKIQIYVWFAFLFLGPLGPLRGPTNRILSNFSKNSKIYIFDKKRTPRRCRAAASFEQKARRRRAFFKRRLGEDASPEAWREAIQALRIYRFFYSVITD